MLISHLMSLKYYLLTHMMRTSVKIAEILNCALFQKYIFACDQSSFFPFLLQNYQLNFVFLH